MASLLGFSIHTFVWYIEGLMGSIARPSGSKCIADALLLSFLSPLPLALTIHCMSFGRLMDVLKGRWEAKRGGFVEVAGLGRHRPAANEPVACPIVRSAVCTVAKVVRRSLQGCGIRLSKHFATVGLRHTRCEKAMFCHKVCDASVSAYCVYLLM